MRMWYSVGCGTWGGRRVYVQANGHGSESRVFHWFDLPSDVEKSLEFEKSKAKKLKKGQMQGF